MVGAALASLIYNYVLCPQEQSCSEKLSMLLGRTPDLQDDEDWEERQEQPRRKSMELQTL